MNFVSFILHVPVGRDAIATALPLLKYFAKSGKAEKITQTIWIAGDLNNKMSRNLLKDALTFMVNILFKYLHRLCAIILYCVY